MTSDFQRVYDHAVRQLPRLASRGTSAIHGWLQAGCIVETDINPTISRLAERNPQIGGFAYFTQAVLKAKQEREASLPTPGTFTPSGTPEEAEARKAKMIAVNWRQLGRRNPENERWLVEYEARHGSVQV